MNSDQYSSDGIYVFSDDGNTLEITVPEQMYSYGCECYIDTIPGYYDLYLYSHEAISNFVSFEIISW